MHNTVTATTAVADASLHGVAGDSLNHMSKMAEHNTMLGTTTGTKRDTRDMETDMVPRVIGTPAPQEQLAS